MLPGFEPGSFPCCGIIQGSRPLSQEVFMRIYGNSINLAAGTPVTQLTVICYLVILLLPKTFN